MTSPRPIFVIGAERSGTTLLRLILDAHPAIAIGPESGFLRAVQDTLTIRDWNFGDGWFERFGVTRQEMVTRLADLYDGIFASYARGRGKQRWGDKTPMHRWLVDVALELYPQAVFVGIVRHPGAVCVSRQRSFGRGLDESVQMWVSAAHRMAADRDRVGADRFTILRYEDLLRDPETILRDLVGFLDEPWSDRLLHHGQAHGRDEVTDGGTRTTDPLDPSRIDAWLDHADADTIERIAAATAPWGHHFGYAPTGALDPAHAPALRPCAVADTTPAPQRPDTTARLQGEAAMLRRELRALRQQELARRQQDGRSH